MSKKDPKKVYLSDGTEVLNNYELINHLRDNEKVKKSDLLVAFCLASRRNNTSARCYPGKSGIARNTGLSMSGVKRSIKNLEKMDVIVFVNTGYEINEKGKKAHNGIATNSYFFTHDMEYQMGLLKDQENHPSNKSEVEREIFETAYLKWKTGGNDKPR